MAVKDTRKRKKRAARPSPQPRRQIQRPAWQKDLLACIGLLVLVVAFFWPVIKGQAFFWEDFTEHYYPFRVYPAVELSEGRFPFWCPYIFGGIPFFAMIDTAVLYPLNWLYVLFVQNGTLSFFITELHTIAHVLLIGIGMYFFCRSLGISRIGAGGGAVTFMLSGVVVHHLFHVVILNPMAWLPVVFMLFIRAIDRLNFKTAIAAGSVLGILISAGHPQVFVYVAYAMGLYTLVCLIGQVWSSGVNRDTLRTAGVSVTIIAIGMGLAATILLPMFELINFSLRPSVSYETATSYSLQLQQLITLLMPDFYGRTDQTIWDYWGPGRQMYGHFWETYIYTGVLPLVLAGAAFALNRERLPRFLGWMAVLSLLMSLGGSTPVYKLMYEVVPGIDKFRAPARFGILFSFAVATLVGYALDILMNAHRLADVSARLRRYLMVTGVLAVLGVIIVILGGNPLMDWLATGEELRQVAKGAMASQSGRFVFYLLMSFGLLIGFRTIPRWNTTIAAVAIALIVIDLFSAGYAFNVGKKRIDEFYPDNELVRFLQQRQQEEWGRASLRSGSQMLLRRNAGMLSRIFTLEGYASPLRLDRILPPIEGSPALDLMNVTYRITVDHQAGTLGFEKNPDALPRTFVVRNYVVARDMEAVTRVMNDSTFDYRTTVTLDDTLLLDISLDSSIATETPAITHYDSNRIVVSVTMNEPGILVLSEVYYPAWRAYIDGQAAPVFIADGVLRAVALTAGEHTVEFRYESSLFAAGSVISSIALLGILLTGIYSWKQKREETDS